MAKYSVLPHNVWQRNDGRSASIHGALPWMSDADKANWEMVQKGWTVYNPLTNQYGLGRLPFETQEAAQAFADTHRPSAIGIGD